MYFPVGTKQNINNNRKSYALKIWRIFLDLEAKFLLIKMIFLADSRFVPLFGKPNITKIEQVSGFNPNYKMRKLALLGAFAEMQIATICFVIII